MQTLGRSQVLERRSVAQEIDDIEEDIEEDG